MSLRDDLVPVVDETRAIVDELGFRVHTVAVRTRTWSGGERGRGTATDVDVTLSPKPKVSEPPPALVIAAPGKFEQGDRYVRKISATYTEAQLAGSSLTAAKEFFWVIDGDLYRLVGTPEKRPLEWRVHLRRIVGR